MKKNDKLHVSITSEDKATLKRRAASCRMTLSQYVLYILMLTKPKIPD